MNLLSEIYQIPNGETYYTDIPKLNAALLPVLETEQCIKFGTEYYTDILSVEFAVQDFKIDFLKNFKLVSDGFINLFKSNRFTPQLMASGKFFLAKNKLSAHKEHQLKLFKLIVPENVISPIDVVVTCISGLIPNLSTIEAEMLDPLVDWSNKILGDREYAGKVWVLKDKPKLDVDSAYRKLRVHFDDRRGSGQGDVEFYKAYSTVSAFIKTNEDIEELEKFANSMLNGKLIYKMQLITDNLRAIYKEGYVNNLADTKIGPVKDLALNAARAIELLSIILFEIKSITYVHGKNIEKINQNL